MEHKTRTTIYVVRPTPGLRPPKQSQQVTSIIIKILQQAISLLPYFLQMFSHTLSPRVLISLDKVSAKHNVYS